MYPCINHGDGSFGASRSNTFAGRGWAMTDQFVSDGQFDHPALAFNIAFNIYEGARCVFYQALNINANGYCDLFPLSLANSISFIHD